MRLLQLSLAGFRLLAAVVWDLKEVAGRSNVGFGVVIGRYLVSILGSCVAEKWWRLGISTNGLRDDGIAVCVNMLALIFCLPGAIVGEDHWVDRDTILGCSSRSTCGKSDDVVGVVPGVVPGVVAERSLDDFWDGD
ncbi:hypothetical protein IFM5058_10705 [Aspergillus udagawae]|nr:hypothetical protein IFM5058_10705 [Aspergillus udagawae]